MDENEHCEICCGAGRTTKWVRDNLLKALLDALFENDAHIWQL